MLDENNCTSNFFENFESYEENIRTLRLNVINDNSLDSKQKIIKSYEIEYEYLENQIRALIYSNDEMSKFNMNDEIIVESRAENLKFMQKYLIKLNKIRAEIVALDPTHPIVDVSETLMEISDEIPNLHNLDDDLNAPIKDKVFKLEDTANYNEIDYIEEYKNSQRSYIKDDTENDFHNQGSIINEINL
jgi:hypothetical protein